MLFDDDDDGDTFISNYDKHEPNIPDHSAARNTTQVRTGAPFSLSTNR